MRHFPAISARFADRPWLTALVCALALAGVAFALRWHQFVPILSKWETLQYDFIYGTAWPHFSFAIGPRANIGGTGYPLLDIGRYLTDWHGLTLTGFRLVAFIYALVTYAGLIVVFARWFGLVPAILGTTMAVVSTGYVFFSNQVLVLVPSLLLCILLVERCQKLTERPNDLGLIFVIGAILAMLIIHYGMGRFFAAGWMAYFFAARIAHLVKSAPSVASARPHLIGEAKTAGLMIAVGVVLLCLLDFSNFRALTDPWNVFFPRVGTEVEMAPENLLPTIVRNLALLAEMLLPIGTWTGNPEPLLNGARTNVLNAWHTPFLLLGFAVALRHTFQRLRAAEWPYLSLHVIAGLTIGLTLFSQHYGPVSTISPFRIYGGYFAITGYLCIAMRWLWCFAGRLPNFGRAAVLLAMSALIIAGAGSISAQSSLLRTRIADKARPDSTGAQFIPVPEHLPPEDHPIAFLHARYLKLAEMTAQAMACGTPGGMRYLPVSPHLLLNRGKYDGLHYLSDYNMLSTSFGLYLRSAGVPAGYLVVHDREGPTPGRPGNGYRGKPPVFSGPVRWEGGELLYPEFQAPDAVLRPLDARTPPAVIVGFSKAEAEMARFFAGKNRLDLRLLPPVDSLKTVSGTGAACP